MAMVPTSPRSEFLMWCKTHDPIFDANAAAIGLSAAQAAKFKADFLAFDNAVAAQDAARSAARAATTTATAAYATMRCTATETVALIRVFAQNAPNPAAVYALAEVPPPAAPSPLPPPGRPTDMVVGLDPSTGAISLRWKANNPRGAAGTSYIIRRRTPGIGSGVFQFVGVTGVKRFVDSTFIAGPDRVEYTVQGQRADSAGSVSDILTINFGAMGGGGGTAGFNIMSQTIGRDETGESMSGGYRAAA